MTKALKVLIPVCLIVTVAVLLIVSGGVPALNLSPVEDWLSPVEDWLSGEDPPEIVFGRQPTVVPVATVGELERLTGEDAFLDVKIVVPRHSSLVQPSVPREILARIDCRTAGGRRVVESLYVAFRLQDRRSQTGYTYVPVLPIALVGAIDLHGKHSKVTAVYSAADAQVSFTAPADG